MPSTFQRSRRGFLQGSLGVFTLAISTKGLITKAWASESNTTKYGADSMPGGTVDNPLVFASIATDGTVTLIAHRAEMGTGVRTSLPMVIADEMEARWEKVNVIQAEANEARYGNQNVDGSRSMRHFLTPMRRVGAAARAMLEEAAALHWSVPRAEVKAVQHEVVHLPTDRRLAYGELAARAATLAIPDTDTLTLKDPADFRYIGNDVVRLVDLENIGQGTATYGTDIRLPDMVLCSRSAPACCGWPTTSRR